MSLGAVGVQRGAGMYGGALQQHPLAAQHQHQHQQQGHQSPRARSQQHQAGGTPNPFATGFEAMGGLEGEGESGGEGVRMCMDECLCVQVWICVCHVRMCS